MPEFFNPQAYNRYAYAINNPLNLVDRNGFAPTTTGPSSGDSRSPDDSTPTRQGDSTASSGQLSKGEAVGAGPVSDPSETPTLGIVGAVQVAQVTIKLRSHENTLFGHAPGGAVVGPSPAAIGTAIGIGAGYAVDKALSRSTTTNENAQDQGTQEGKGDAAKPNDGVGTAGSSPPEDPDDDKNKERIQFGRNPNQESHSFRYTDQAGLNREAVRDAIRADLSKMGETAKEGLIKGQVNVQGTRVSYSAFKLSDGTINVGRITPPR